MKIRFYLEAIAYKIKSIFSRRLSFSSTVFGGKIAKKAAIKQCTRFYESSIDEYSYIGRNCLIQNTEIGKFVSISDNCNLGLPSHPIDYVSTSPVFLQGKNVIKENLASLQFDACKKLIIGNDVWIGTGVLIKSGLTIGDGAIVGAGSVVTHSIPPYEIWAGNPARFIRKRFDNDTIEKLLQIKWWEWDSKKIKEYSNFFYNSKLFIREINVL